MSNEYIVLSDIHGNAPALEAVVAAEGRDADYIILGDIHGLLAHPKQTLRLVKDVGTVTIAGNHDKAIFHYGEGHVNSDALSEFELWHTRENLTHSEQEWMASLPFFTVLTRSGKRICATHAMPWPEKASGYEQGNAGIRKRDITRIASIVGEDYDFVLSGHTHTRYSLDCSEWGHDVQFVNPGTLGYEGTYTVLDVATGATTHKSVEPHSDALRDHIDSVLPAAAPSVEQWL